MIDLFFTHFFVNSISTSVLILLILAIKKIFKKHITIRWQHNIGLLLLAILIIQFIPIQFFRVENLCNWVINNINMNGNTTSIISQLNTRESNLNYGTDLMQDLTLSVSRFAPKHLILSLIIIWFIGVLAFTIITAMSCYKIMLIKKSLKLIEDKKTKLLFQQTKIKLKISKNLILGESVLVETPMIMGFLRTTVVLPFGIINKLSTDDIKYILFHELSHYKSKDVLINHIMCLLQILYWFNPTVWLAFKQIRIDREIACDNSVLKNLDKSCHFDYGRTIITFVEKMSQPTYLSVSADMGGSKQQIKNRIEKIADFEIESKHLKIKSIITFTLVGCLILSQIPTISAMTYDNSKYELYGAQPIYEDLSSYFNGYDGSFVLYDLQADEYSIYNEEKSLTRVSPDSTYKIYNALIALDTNVIKANHSTMSWNGTNYPFETWNKNHDLSSAMKNSVNWYFQNIDKSIGIKDLQNYYKRISYGNYDVSGGISDYWMESSLLISPVEQVQLLKKFYLNDGTTFKTESVDTVKDILKLSEKDGVVLSGKTGSGTVNGKSINGWFIGYIENNGNTYIFATNIQGNDGVSGRIATNITLSILNDKDIY